MRRNGLASLRLIVWHQEDPGSVDWGVVPSNGGGLAQEAYAKLRAFVADVRDAGYERLTVSFAPMGENDPRSGSYSARLFEQNWAVIREARTILHRFGPASIHLDLLNDGAAGPERAPSVRARTADYLRRLYDRYVSAFGSEGVTVSTIASVDDDSTRACLEALLDALGRTGRGLPGYFELHLAYDRSRAGSALDALDSLLRERGLGQTFVIGETAYDDAGVAAAIREFVAGHQRAIVEITQWPLASDQPCEDLSESPPYSAEAYLALKEGRGG